MLTLDVVKSRQSDILIGVPLLMKIKNDLKPTIYRTKREEEGLLRWIEWDRAAPKRYPRAQSFSNAPRAFAIVLRHLQLVLFGSLTNSAGFRHLLQLAHLRIAYPKVDSASGLEPGIQFLSI